MAAPPAASPATSSTTARSIFNRSNALTYAGVVSGTGSLTQAGAGTLTLTGANTYTGGTTISAGTLQIGSGGTTGSLVGDIVDNGALIFNRSNALTYAGTISGTGTVTKLGSSARLTLTGDNTYTGSTTISAGRCMVGNGGTTGSLVGNIVDNAALIFNRSDALTYGGDDQRHRHGHQERRRNADADRRQHLCRQPRRSAPARCRSAMAAPAGAVVGNIVAMPAR